MSSPATCATPNPRLKMSHVTHLTSHVTHITSHVTHITSHVTRRTSHVTRTMRRTYTSVTSNLRNAEPKVEDIPLKRRELANGDLAFQTQNKAVPQNTVHGTQKDKERQRDKGSHCQRLRDPHAQRAGVVCGPPAQIRVANAENIALELVGFACEGAYCAHCPNRLGGAIGCFAQRILPVYIYTSIRAYMYIYIYIYMYVYIHICIQTKTKVCMNTFVCIRIHIYVYVYICIYVYIHIYVNMYIFVSATYERVTNSTFERVTNSVYECVNTYEFTCCALVSTLNVHSYSYKCTLIFKWVTNSRYECVNNYVLTWFRHISTLSYIHMYKNVYSYSHESQTQYMDMSTMQSSPGIASSAHLQMRRRARTQGAHQQRWQESPASSSSWPKKKKAKVRIWNPLGKLRILQGVWVRKGEIGREGEYIYIYIYMYIYICTYMW